MVKVLCEVEVTWEFWFLASGHDDELYFASVYKVVTTTQNVLEHRSDIFIATNIYLTIKLLLKGK